MPSPLHALHLYLKCGLTSAALSPLTILPVSLPKPAFSPGVPAAVAADPMPSGFRQDDLEKLARGLRRAQRVAEHDLGTLPRLGFDPAAVVAEVGGDGDALLAWVRERTAWVPGRGMLRGAQGVLMDRCGSHLDRALLVADLVARTGREVRLARARLDGEAVAERLDPALTTARARLAARQAARRESAEGTDLASLSELSGRTQDDLRGQLAEARSTRQRLAEDAYGWTLPLAEELAAAVGMDGGEADHAREQAALAAFRNRAAAAMADVWWAQVRDGDGWRDLWWDEEGGAPDPEATHAPDAVPGDQQHRVTIRVVAERLHDGALTTETALEVTSPAAELSGRNVRLHFAPLTRIGSVAGIQPGDDAVLALARDETEWLPSLVVAGERESQGSIRIDGTVNPRPTKIASHRQLGEAVGKLGNLGRDAAPEGDCSAVWVEITTGGPGAAERTRRRQIFDLVGPARRAGDAGAVSLGDDDRLRRGVAFTGGLTLLVTGCALDPAWVRHRGLEAFVANRRALTDMIWAESEGHRQRALEALAEVEETSGTLHAFDLLRHGHSRVAASTYLDRPNVVALHETTDLRDGKPVQAYGFDVIAHEVGVLPGGELTRRRARLEQGVLDTVVEDLLLRDDRPDNCAHLARVTRGRIPWRSAAATGDLGAPEWQLGADLMARLHADLAAGRMVHAPVRPFDHEQGPCAAWWRIDPDTGATLGMGARGWGQDTTTETELQTTNTAALVPASRTYASGLICIATFVLVKIGVALAISAAFGGGANIEIAAKIVDDVMDKYADDFVRWCTARLAGLPL